MMDVALSFIKRVLDQYLMNAFQLADSVVILNGLVDANGNMAHENKNRIVLSLIHLEWETNKAYFGGQRREMELIHQINPPVLLNLDILVSAIFDDYPEALKFLSHAIAFFQANPSLTRSRYPELPEAFSTLKIEIENSSYGKAFELWSALGAKYQPSIIYKVRHVLIQSGEIQTTSARATGAA